MYRSRGYCICLVFILFFSFTLLAYSQEVSEQKWIAIFKTYHTKDIPFFVVEKIDKGIVKIFETKKRFKIEGYQYRFSGLSLEAFIEKIRELKEENILKDEAFVDPEWGTVTMTPEVLEKLTKSVYIVIPNLRSYDIEEDTDEHGGVLYSVTLGVSLKVFDVESGEVLVTMSSTRRFDSERIYPFYEVYEDDAYSGVVKLKKDKEGVERERKKIRKKKDLVLFESEKEKAKLKAIDGCVRLVLNDLEGQIRRNNLFILKTTLTKISNNTFFVALGKNYDITPGLELDMYSLKKIRIGGRDRTIRIYKGLVRVVRVEDNESVIIPVFDDPEMGDQFVDALRSGFITKVFVGAQMLDFKAPNKKDLSNYLPQLWSIDTNLVAPLLGGSFIGDGMSAFFEPQIDVFLIFSDPFMVGVSLGGNYSIYLHNLKVKPYLGMEFIRASSFISNVVWNGQMVSVDFAENIFGVKGSIGFELLLSKYFGVSASFGLRASLPVTVVKFFDKDGKEVNLGDFGYSYLPKIRPLGFSGELAVVWRY